MTPLPGFDGWTRVWSTLTRRGMEREVMEELSLHLKLLEEELLARGASPEEARRRAIEKFGSPQRIQRYAIQTKGAQRRRKNRGMVMDELLQDLRYAFRNLFRERLFSAVVLLTLTLGIGATVAMYSVLHAALLNALPFPEPQELVSAETTIQGNRNLTSFPDFLDYRDRSETFEAFGAILGFTLPVTVTGTEEPERVEMTFATGDVFRALDVEPYLGRLFSEEESSPGGPPVLLLSYGYWQRSFGGSPDVLGQTITLNGSPIPIVGVMPPDFHLMFDTEAWLPGTDGGPMTGIRRYHNWRMLGRLRDGVSLAEAQAELDVIAAQLEEAFPDSNSDKGVEVTFLHDRLVDGYRRTLYLLMGAIGLVLLIACGNVASLLLARGSARGTEMAVRTAVGAGRGRLIRLLLTESLLLALLAGGMGVLLASWLQDLILGYVSLDLLGLEGVTLSGPVLGFALLTAVATALLFGSFPALATTNSEPARELKEGGRGKISGGSRFRNALVVLQVALSVVLLIGSTLLIRSVGRVLAVDPGFDPEGILAAEVALPPGQYQDGESRYRFFVGFEESLLSLPGVESVGMIDRLPIRSPGNNVGIWAPDHPPATSSDVHYAFQRIVTPGYFRTMGVPVLAGRDFQETDDPGSPPAIILSQMSADTVFPGENPLGRQVAVDLGGDQPRFFEVVGVVADQRLSSLRSGTRLAMYFPYNQRRAYSMEVAIRTTGDPMALVRSVQDRLWAMDRGIPLANPERLTDTLGSSVTGSKAMATMLGMFSVTAVFLAAMGLYGVLAFFVAQGRHEIGIRMAMGASRGKVAGLVLRRGMTLVGIGLVLGFAGSLWAGGLLEELLFQTSATDPLTYGAAGLLLGLIALGACMLPAWRALRLDPMVAFRTD